MADKKAKGKGKSRFSEPHKNCGWKGHKKEDCWEEGGGKARKAPKGWKSRGKKEKSTAKDEKSKGKSSKANTASDEKNSEPDGVWLAAIEDGRDINNLEEAYSMGVDSTMPSVTMVKNRLFFEMDVVS